MKSGVGLKGEKGARERETGKRVSRKVSSVSSGSDVRAILTADWHLSHKPPIARSCEKDWYGVLRDYLRQISSLQHKLSFPGVLGDPVPIICAGDAMHRWNEPPELINLALECMPVIWSVAGNHDLPNHSYSDIKKSSYWTLVKAGKVLNLEPENGCSFNLSREIAMHGFPCGFPPQPLIDSHDLCQEIAVIHDYVWVKDAGYPDAPEDKRLKTYKKNLVGYDVAVIGDNHKTFVKYIDSVCVVNPGSLLRRNIDQIEHKPCVWLLKYDNTVEPFYLDTSKDTFIDKRDLNKAKYVDKQVEEFVDSLKDLKELKLDFQEAVFRHLEKQKVSQEVKKLVLEALGC